MSITVRKKDYTFETTSPSYWYGDNKFVSTFLSALSITFPAGERFFIEAVRDCSQMDMPTQLKEDVRAFTQQEAQHSKAHAAFNAWLQAKGYRAEEFENFVKALLKVAAKLPKKHRLAATCALEHITALMADRLVTESDEFAEPICDEFREFWKWHALEESEHKSVAFDVYKYNDYDEATRIATQASATLVLVVVIAAGHLYLSWTKRGVRGPADVLWGLNKLVGPRGFLTRSVPKYLEYYKVGFKP